MKLLRRILGALVWIWGRTPFPSPWCGPDSVGRAIDRSLALRFRLPVRIALLVGWMLWLPRSLVLATQQTYKHGATARGHGAGSVGWQLIDQIRLAWRCGLSPDSYYPYRFFSGDEREKARDYLPNHQAAALFDFLNSEKVDVIEDKLAVENHLRSRELPVVHTLAVGRNGEVKWRDNRPLSRLPDHDLIIKPNGGMQGRDVVRARFRQADRFEINGREITSSVLIEYLQQRSAKEPYLLQPCLRNHPDLDVISPDTLSTIRLITGRYPDGRCQPITAVLKIPEPGAAADNFAAGSWASPLDLESGRLSAATKKEPLTPDLEMHPQSHVPIAGRIVPFWSETLDLALLAHRTLPSFVFLGWDIAVTNEGPTILEVNGTWDAKLVQKPGFRPLGRTSFMDVARAWLNSDGTKKTTPSVPAPGGSVFAAAGLT